MRNLFILLIMVFFIFGCVEPTVKKTTETIIKYEGKTWEIIGTNQQIYPTPETTTLKEKFFSMFGSKLYAVPTVTPLQAEADFKDGIVYGENSYSSADSIYQNIIHYIDVGALVGVDQKLLVNVKFRMLDQANNANSPMVHVRAKGSTSAWKILNPSLTEDEECLLVTDEHGVIEWYHDNNAPYEWNPTSFGWDEIIGFADYYIIGTPIL